MTEPASSATEAISPPEPAASGGVEQPQVLRHELKRAWRTSVQLGLSLLGTWSVALLVRFAVPRYLGPKDFGDLNFAEMFANGFFVFASLGIDTYSMREIAVRPAHASDYFGGVQALRAVLSLALLGVMAAILNIEGKSVGVQAATLVWGLTWAVTALNSTLSTLLQATGATQRLAVANVLAKVIWGVGLWVLILVPGIGAHGLYIFALPALGAELLKTGFILPAARYAVNLDFRLDMAATRSVLAASFPFYLSTLAYSLAGPLNLWVLDLIKSDPRELGWYGATLNVASLAMIFSPLFNWVLLPLLSRARARSEQEVEFILGRALEAFLLAAIPVLLLASLGADYVVDLAFGAEYAPATVALRFWLAMIVFTYAAMIISMGLVAHGFSWSLSSLSLISVVLAPAVCTVSTPAFGRWLGQGGEAAGAALSVTISEAVVACLGAWRIGRGVVTPRFVRAIAKSALVSTLVVGADRALLDLGGVRLGVDLILYALLLLLTRTVDIAEVREVIRSVRTARAAGSDPPPPS